MYIEDISDAPDSALPVDAFKAHLRLGTGFTEDTVQVSVLVGFLRAAMALVEARIGKVLLVKTVEWTTDSLGATTALPVAPVVSLTRVLLQNTNSGDLDVTDQFTIKRDQHRPVLCAAGLGFTGLAAGARAVVRLEVGLAAQWGDVPSDIAQAVLLLATHYYEHRDQTGLDQGCMPFGVTALLQRHRLMRLSGGGVA